MAFPEQDYDRTARDFDGLNARLVDVWESVFPDLPDPESNNPLNLIRWGVCDVGNLLDYYISRIGRQGFVATCTDRKWMIALGKRTGYTLSGATAATCDVTLTLTNAPLPGTVTIPAGTVVQTMDADAPIVGELQADVIFVPGDTVKTGSWKHAQTRTRAFTPAGTESEEFYLPAGPYLDGSAAFSTVLGAWTEQETLLQSDATDRDFVVLVDQNDRATVRTGDGVNGAKPDSGFTATYEIGGGTAGNVTVGTLTRIIGTFADSLGNPASITVTNAAAASGGTDRETVNAARVLIPASVAAPRASVTREDFETHALLVPGVVRALMLSAYEDTAVPENEGRLYVVPAGGGTPSSALLAAVETMVTETYPPPITFRVLVVPAVYQTIDVVCTVWLREGYAATTVRAAIWAALTAWFAPTDTDGTANANVDFGYNFKDADGLPAGEVAWSDLFNAVRDVAGVRKVGPGPDEFLLNGERDDVELDNHKFPALGTLTIYNGATGAQI